MIKRIGGAYRNAHNELAYKVMARGVVFEVAVCGKVFRVRDLVGPGRAVPDGIGAAMNEVRKFLEARGGAAAAACFAFCFG